MCDYTCLDLTDMLVDVHININIFRYLYVDTVLMEYILGTSVTIPLWTVECAMFNSCADKGAHSRSADN